HRAGRRRFLWCDGTAAAAGAGPTGEVWASLPLYPIDRHFLRFSLHLNRLERLDGRLLLELLVKRLGDEDLVRAGLAAQPVGGVHRVADHGVFESPVGADVAGTHFAEIHRDPNLHLRAALRTP